MNLSPLALALLTSFVAVTAAGAAPDNFILHAEPRSLSELVFTDDEGRSRTVADFRGKIVLLNIWATWCVPCRREMPTLDRLQAQLGGSDFEVVALSIDRAGLEVIRKFYGKAGVQSLAIYIDNSGGATRALGAVGVPTTLLIDREGRELGRLVGPAEWDTAEMIDFLKSIISHRKDASERGTVPDLRAPHERSRRARTVGLDRPKL